MKNSSSPDPAGVFGNLSSSGREILSLSENSSDFLADRPSSEPFCLEVPSPDPFCRIDPNLSPGRSKSSDGFFETRENLGESPPSFSVVRLLSSEPFCRVDPSLSKDIRSKSSDGFFDTRDDSPSSPEPPRLRLGFNLSPAVSDCEVRNLSDLSGSSGRRILRVAVISSVFRLGSDGGDKAPSRRDEDNFSASEAARSSSSKGLFVIRP